MNISNIDFKQEINHINDLNVQIFSLVKHNNWNELLSLIDNNDIDYNIKDSSGIYLLEHCINNNKIDLIKSLINKNINIYILTEDNKSILYEIIKFSRFDILDLILDFNKHNIGKNIVDMQDNNGFNSLFYAVNFFNITAFEKLLPHITNFHVFNKFGDNITHAIIRKNNLDMLKLLHNYFDDYKSKNINGETCLHIIVKNKFYDILDYFINKYHSHLHLIINDSDYVNNFSVLHYIAILNDIQIVDIFNKYNLFSLFDGNIQDNSGNIFYHYFIKNIIDNKNLDVNSINNILNINNIFFNFISWNNDHYNIDGDTPSHIFFKSINIFINNNLSILVNKIFEITNLNIQNFNGESVFFIIVKHNYWTQILNLLPSKKIDLFIISNKKTIFDYIKHSELDSLLHVTTLSYLGQLQHVNKDVKWKNYWDNRCKNDITIKDLNETELDIYKDINPHESKSVCYNIIYNKLKENVNFFINNKTIKDVYSYPLKHRIIPTIINYPNVVVSTFSGLRLDILCGLIYLNNKFKNTLSTIHLIHNKDNIVKCNNNVCEIINFEINWNNKIFSFIVDDFIKHINLIFTNQIDVSFYIIPIGIKLGQFNHANYLIIDFNKRIIERFEPHGAFNPTSMNYNPNDLDKNILFNIVDKINNVIHEMGSTNTFQYLKPSDYLPKIGFQVKEMSELSNDYIGDPNGFCALWCIWWCEQKLISPNINSKKLFKYLTKELINNNISYKKLIRDYSYFVVSLRDSILNKVDININDWINDNLSNKQIYDLNHYLLEYINTVIDSSLSI